MRILLLAYACEPAEGSEPGAGWAFARMLSGLGEVVVITRANNRAPIEAGIAALPESRRPEVAYVDLPAWARFWKRGRIGIQPYYVLWQLAALRRARRLHEQRPFDLVWHATLANTWMGSVGGLVGPRFVWGPIGGGVDVPLRMASALGARGSAYEGVRWVVRQIARNLNPLARLGWRRAELILVQNPETRAWLPSRHRARAHVYCNVMLETASPERDVHATEGSRTALFAGRLMPLKGLALGIDALRELPGWRLVVAGEGGDRTRLEKLATDRGVADRVELLGKVPRARVLELMHEADAFLFPSLRDDAGWAVAEAVQAGLPVVCLDRGGPPIIAGGGVRITDPAQTASAIAAALAAAPESTARGIDVSFAAREAELMRILAEAGITGTEVPAG